MTARFVVRLLDAAGELLAWADVSATAKPQGRPRSTPFFADGRTQFVIERDGVASQVVIHWVDLDVVRVGPDIAPTPVQLGQVFDFTWLGPVWMVEGSKVDVPLPAVTVRRAVAIAPPTGSLVATSN
jgi:hypothetical protein